VQADEVVHAAGAVESLEQGALVRVQLRQREVVAEPRPEEVERAVGRREALERLP
jgi:hypothetical protein